MAHPATSKLPRSDAERIGDQLIARFRIYCTTTVPTTGRITHYYESGAGRHYFSRLGELLRFEPTNPEDLL